MQAISLQSILSTSTFKDFDIPNSALCRSLEPHSHQGIPSGGTYLDLKTQGSLPENSPKNLPETLNISAPIPSYKTPLNSPQKEERGSLKKILPLAGAVIGAVLPIIYLNKTKGKSLNTDILKNGKAFDKLKEAGEYFEIDGIKEILSTAGGAIAGGLLGGLISDRNRENRKEKVKNAIFEMVNITVPTLFVVGAEKLLNSFKNVKINPALKKALPIALGVGLGAPVASKISGAINKKAFKEDKSKQRHFRPKDYLVHIDDIVTTFALAKLPFLKAIPFDKILSLIYIHCGFEAGSADTKGHGHHHH